jgi:hypothetical protein
MFVAGTGTARLPSTKIRVYLLPDKGKMFLPMADVALLGL